MYKTQPRFQAPGPAAQAGWFVAMLLVSTAFIPAGSARAGGLPSDDKPYAAGHKTSDGNPVIDDDKSPGNSPARNVVVFIADDHGPDAGAYGNPVIRTPNLDALAAEGMLFTHAFATTASCSASRSVILTGLHNHRNGQFGHGHDFHHFQAFDTIRSLPVLLAEAGYRTASAGKYHVAPEEVFHFQEYIEGHARDVISMVDHARPFLEAEDDRPFFLYVATSDPHRGGDRVPTNRASAGAPPAGEAPAGDDPPASDGEHPTLTPDPFGNRPQGYPGIGPATYDPDDVLVPDWLPDTPVTRAEIAEYYQSVSRVDQGFGYLMRLLEELDLYETTLIVYLSDHGMAMPGAKTTVYEPGLRSPLIVRHPDSPEQGAVTDAMVSWVDITPTILDFAGVAEPSYRQQVQSEGIRKHLPETHGLHGRSFLHVLEGGKPEGFDRVEASHTFHEIQMYYPMRVVRDRDYKLIWNIAHPLPFPFATDLWASSTWQQVHRRGPEASFGVRSVDAYLHRPEFELYDVRNDPWESKNLANRPEYAEVLERYREMMWEFQVRTADPWLLKWTYE